MATSAAACWRLASTWKRPRSRILGWLAGSSLDSAARARSSPEPSRGDYASAGSGGATLSHPSLEAMRRNEGAIEFATLGSGNHFIELQSDEDGRLWLMVHSGSRGIGPAIRDHHWVTARTLAAGSGRWMPPATKGPGISATLPGRDASRTQAEGRWREVGTVIEATLGAPPLLGDRHHDRSQPRVARTPRRA